MLIAPSERPGPTSNLEAAAGQLDQAPLGLDRRGERGLPSLSLYLWCRRWSDTQVVTGPSMASPPLWSLRP
jgi:hypothetical protein